MTATLIDGKAFAATVRQRIAKAVATLKAEHNLTPGLAVVLVGNDPASEVYVRNKGIATEEAGMNSYEFRLPADTAQTTLLEKVHELNADPNVHGILVQFPVPDQIDQDMVVNTISPAKDVDGLNPINAGLLASGKPALIPCTPLGSVMLAKAVLPDLSGKKALVVGRSNLVGKPVAQLLLQENCTVTIAHSRTQNLEKECQQADIIIAAVGRPQFVKGAWIKDGACVIDVGINRVPAPEKGEGKTKLVGDVEFDVAKTRAGFITPVPGGVGPMTITCLLLNTLPAACATHNIARPDL